MTTDLQSYSLTAGWLDQTRPKDAANDSGGTLTAGVAVNTTAYSQNTSGGWSPNDWYYQPFTAHCPIKLSMSEVEKLRQAAKRDAKLKAILEKFTDQIEVIVDFK